MNSHLLPPTRMSQVALHGTACKGCRRRGRKCDRTLPACLSCRRRGVECEGYVTRWPGVAARGKLAGKSIPVHEKSAKTSNPRPARVKRGDAPLSSTERGHIDRDLGHSSLDQNDSHLKGLRVIGYEELERLINHCKMSSHLAIEYHH